MSTDNTDLLREIEEILETSNRQPVQVRSQFLTRIHAALSADTTTTLKHYERDVARQGRTIRNLTEGYRGLEAEIKRVDKENVRLRALMAHHIKP